MILVLLTASQAALLAEHCPDADLRGMLQRKLNFELTLPTPAPRLVQYADFQDGGDVAMMAFYSVEDADQAWAAWGNAMAADDLPPLMFTREKVPA